MASLSINEQCKIISKTHIDAKVEVLNDLLAEISEQGYTSIAQVRSSIISHIESVEKLRVSHE